MCYVAYTATPFANILINHLAIDRQVFDDLYPRDFIVALPRPNGYTGAEQLFGRESLPGEQGDGQVGLDVIDFVPDHEADQLTPRSQDVPGYVARVVPSMRTALLDFVLAAAAREQRMGCEAAASMLIHTHHRVPVQLQLGEALRQHVSQLRQSWRYDRNSIRPELERRWNEGFRPVIASVDLSRDVAFDQIEGFIDRLFREPIPVLVLSSASPDELDYEMDPTLKAIVVGGNRLSRGMTLEGLLVSYYLRRANCYDTLLQMGRWFGFRERYVELTRLWTTEELAGWFRDLALAEEELRREIERYERENLTPLDFGPRIRSHPVMMITARNKMGSARAVLQNYSGALLQTTSFRLEERPWLLHNLDATCSFLGQLGRPNHAGAASSRPVWRNVPWQAIDTFLSDYRVDPRSTLELGAVRQYLQRQARQEELLEWWVSVRGRTALDDELGGEPMLSVEGAPMNRIARTRLRSAPHSIGSLVNPAVLGSEPGTGDEETGLTREEMDGRRAPGLPAGRAVYLALDSAGRRHLLVPVPDGTEPITQRETRGLQVCTERFRIGDNPEWLCIDLVCLDPTQHATFSAVAQDLLIALGRSTVTSHEAVVRALNRWRAFWRAKATGLSQEAALGLFGELWFLRRWLPPIGAADDEALVALAGHQAVVGLEQPVRVGGLFEGHATAYLTAIEEGGEPLRPPQERDALRTRAVIIQQVEGGEAEVLDRSAGAPAQRRGKVVDPRASARAIGVEFAGQEQVVSRQEASGLCRGRHVADHPTAGR